MSIYNKYLKYKMKYLDLKKQLGGATEGNPTPVVRSVMPAIPKQEIYMPFFFLFYTETIKIVPPNSTVVFISSCGLEVFSDNKKRLKLIELFKRKNSLLLDPVKNKKLISELIEYPMYVHTSGSEYLDLKFDPHLIYHQHESASCSGLFNFSKGICPLTVDLKFKKKDTVRIRQEEALQMYQNSIVPSTEDINSIFGERVSLSLNEFVKQLRSTYPELTLESLMTSNPGIYYIVSCRSPCDKKSFYDISRIEQKQLEHQKFIYEGIRNFKELRISSEDLLLNVRGYIDKYGKDDFLVGLSEYISKKYKGIQVKIIDYNREVEKLIKKIKELERNTKRSQKTLTREISELNKLLKRYNQLKDRSVELLVVFDSIKTLIDI